MSGIHEQQLYSSLACFLHQRLQSFSSKLLLFIDVGLFRDLFYFPPPEAFFLERLGFAV